MNVEHIANKREIHKQGNNTMNKSLLFTIIAALALVAGIICGKKGVFDNLNCSTRKGK